MELGPKSKRLILIPSARLSDVSLTGGVPARISAVFPLIRIGESITPSSSKANSSSSGAVDSDSSVSSSFSEVGLISTIGSVASSVSPSGSCSFSSDSASM